MASQEFVPATLPLPADDWYIARDVWDMYWANGGQSLPFDWHGARHTFIGLACASGVKGLGVIAKAEHQETGADLSVEMLGMVWGGDKTPIAIGTFALRDCDAEMLTGSVTDDIASGEVVKSHPSRSDDVLDLHLVLAAVCAETPELQTKYAERAKSVHSPKPVDLSFISGFYGSFIDRMLAYGPRTPKQV